MNVVPTKDEDNVFKTLADSTVRSENEIDKISAQTVGSNTLSMVSGGIEPDFLILSCYTHKITGNAPNNITGAVGKYLKGKGLNDDNGGNVVDDNNDGQLTYPEFVDAVIGAVSDAKNLVDLAKNDVTNQKDFIINYLKKVLAKPDLRMPKVIPTNRTTEVAMEKTKVDEIIKNNMPGYISVSLISNEIQKLVKQQRAFSNAEELASTSYVLMVKAMDYLLKEGIVVKTSNSISMEKLKQKLQGELTDVELK
jgi:hypothetical protein